jgi:hypothetical protein
MIINGWIVFLIYWYDEDRYYNEMRVHIDGLFGAEKLIDFKNHEMTFLDNRRGEELQSLSPHALTVFW